ncbi:hypothetical protein H0H92_006972, partial [Tricholoma furcatifolium]
IGAVNIPQEKYGHWYTVLSIEGIPGAGTFRIDLVAKDQALNFFIPKPSATISVKLFAKHKTQTWHSDILIAQGAMQFHSLVVGETQGVLTGGVSMLYHTLTIKVVILNPTTDYSKKNPINPTLIFNIAVITRPDLRRFTVDPAPLEVNPTLAKAMDGIRCLANVGLTFSELNPIAKTVMSLVNLSVTQFDSLLKRNESVLLLVEELNQVNALVVDWDNLSHVEHQPQAHRGRVCRELLPEIGQCLNLLQQLSQENTLSVESIKEVDNHRKKLGELVKLFKSNQQLDTQTAVLEVNKTVSTVHNMFSKSNNNQINNNKDIVLSKLHVAKDGGAVGSKVCLEGTRIALLQRIYDWALNSLDERVLLLYGGAGKGKSAIAHTVAKRLESSGRAI